MQGGYQLGLDGHHPSSTLQRGGDAGRQTAASHRHKHGVQGGHLPFEFQTERPVAGHHLCLAVGVYHHRPGLLGTTHAGPVGVGVERPGDVHRGAQRAQPVHLGRRGGLGHVDLRGVAQFPGHVGHRQTGVASGRGNQSGVGNRSGQHAVEGATRFEAAGVLEQFELEGHRRAEHGAFDLDDRGAPHPPDQAFLSSDHRIPVHHRPIVPHRSSAPAADPGRHTPSRPTVPIHPCRSGGPQWTRIGVGAHFGAADVRPGGYRRGTVRSRYGRPTGAVSASRPGGTSVETHSHQ